jgi:hypothetical protein
MTDRNISPRRFLRNAAGVSAGVIGLPYIIRSSALGADGAVAPSGRIVIGCISVGLLGEIAMLLERKLQWDPAKEQFVNDPEATRLLSRPMRAPWHLL